MNRPECFRFDPVFFFLFLFSKFKTSIRQETTEQNKIWVLLFPMIGKKFKILIDGDGDDDDEDDEPKRKMKIFFPMNSICGLGKLLFYLLLGLVFLAITKDSVNDMKP